MQLQAQVLKFLHDAQHDPHLATTVDILNIDQIMSHTTKQVGAMIILAIKTKLP